MLSPARILFLDIHGVVENMHSATHETFDQTALQQIYRISAETGCLIVITSNHKVVHSLAEIRQWFFNHSIFVFDVTPTMPYANRKSEIREWLEDAKYRHKLDVGSFCVVDDESVGFPEHEVRTTYQQGLTPDLANSIIQVLLKSEVAV